MEPDANKVIQRNNEMLKDKEINRTFFFFVVAGFFFVTLRLRAGWFAKKKKDDSDTKQPGGKVKNSLDLYLPKFNGYP